MHTIAPPERVDPDTATEHLPSLNDIIERLEGIPEDAWWPGPTYRSPDQTRHCVLSHIFEWYGQGGMDEFESLYSTVYCIGRVNDGEHPDYPQPTPKQRCLAYLRNLRDGIEETTMESMHAEYLALKSEVRP